MWGRTIQVNSPCSDDERDSGAATLSEGKSTLDIGGIVNHNAQGTQPAFGAGSPVNQFGTPTGETAPPVNQFGTPVNQFGTPVNQFGTPSNQFGGPAAPGSFGGAPSGLPASATKVSSDGPGKKVLTVLGALLGLGLLILKFSGLGLGIFAALQGPPEMPATLATLPKAPSSQFVTFLDAMEAQIRADNDRSVKVDSAVYEGNGVVLLGLVTDFKANDADDIAEWSGQGGAQVQKIGDNQCVAASGAGGAYTMCIRTGFGKTSFVAAVNSADTAAVVEANDELYKKS